MAALHDGATLSEPSRSAGAIEAIPAARRILFIDNIRWSMIVLVLSMHACDTYSPFGNWYYTDRRPMGVATALGFAVYQSFLQAFFMALLFFIAGYFAAPARDRRTFGRFARDRFVRLGLPTLLYMFVVGPLTQYFLSHTWGSGGFGHQWLTHLADGEWLSETGPMWFCAALLLFSLAYGLIGGSAAKNNPGDAPSAVAVIAFIAVMALSTFAVRVFLPEGVSVLNVHPGDFPQYVLMFAAGIVAYRGRWLERLPARMGTRWAAVLLPASVALFAALIAFGGALRGDTASYSGGLNLVSLGKCIWESIVCIGMAFALLVLYRRFFNHQDRLARFLSDNAFAVYLFHPPVIIGLAILLHPLAAPAPLRAAILTFAAALVVFPLSAYLFRQIPYLRRIL